MKKLKFNVVELPNKIGMFWQTGQQMAEALRMDILDILTFKHR